LSSEQSVRTYMVGDEVQMTVELVHEMNLLRVYVAFRHETGEAVPELVLGDEDVPDYDRLAGGEKRIPLIALSSAVSQKLPNVRDTK
jgi:hypothetical protein